MSNEDNPNINAFNIIARRATTARWVVMSKDRQRVVKDPGLDKPFCTRIKRLAEQVAREVGGVAVTLEDALHLLINPDINVDKLLQ